MIQQVNKRLAANPAYFSTILLAIGVLVFSQFPAGIASRPLLLVCVFLLIFCIPSYLITRIFFSDQTLDLPERLLMMLLVGMATCIIGGLYLYKTASGFSTSAWAIVFSPLVICALVDLLLTDRKPGPRSASSLPVLGLNFGQGVLISLGLLLVIAALVIMQSPNSSAKFQGYTQLWLHPCGGATPKVLVGVSSREFAPLDYRLEVRRGESAALGSANIHLNPGEDWQATLPVGDLPLPARTLDIVLYRADRPTEVYRYVALRRPDWSLEQMNEITNSHCQ